MRRRSPCRASSSYSVHRVQCARLKRASSPRFNSSHKQKFCISRPETNDARRGKNADRKFRSGRRPPCLKMKYFHHRGPTCNPSTFRYCRPRRNILPDPTHCPVNVLSTTRPHRNHRSRSTTSRRSTASPTSSAQCQVAPGPRRKTAHERRSARLHPINEQPDGTSVEDQCQPDRRFLPRLARLASGTHIKFLNMPITTQSSIRNGAQVSSSPPHVR